MRFTARIGLIAPSLAVTMLVAGVVFSLWVTMSGGLPGAAQNGIWTFRRIEGLIRFYVFVTASYAWLPVLIFISICEIFNLRSKFVYLMFWQLPLAITLFIGAVENGAQILKWQAFVSLGLPALIGSYVYWLIAGRHAGAWREN